MAYWSRKPPKPSPEVPMIANRQPMTAAVQAIGPTWNHVGPRTHQYWQARAAFFSDELGLVRFANGLLSQAGARCTLVVEHLVDAVTDEWAPIDESMDIVPAQVLREYTGQYAETPGDLIAAHIWAYKSIGEAYMTVEANPEGGLDWAIRSVRSVQFRTADVMVSDLPGGSISDGSARLLPRENVRRLWVPDPTWPLLATSHMRGVLADCERYWALARRIRREAESVLNNGLLFTPGYAHRYPPVPPGGPRDEQVLSEFDRDYYRVAEMAWNDDDSVAAVSALSVHYDTENSTRDPVPPQFIYPGRMLDPKGIDYREEAAEGIARGLDLPTMLALGDGAGGKSSNHWSSWLFEESFVRSSVNPTMDRVTHADLTTAMFRPTLRRLGEQGRWNGNPNLYRVGYDPTPIIVHPDRGATALTLYGLGLMRGLPVLEANGFDGSDVPLPDELATIIKTLSAIRAPTAREQITGGGVSPGAQDVTAVGPSTVRELPPGSPTLAALGHALTPYEAEITDWLSEPVPA